MTAQVEFFCSPREEIEVLRYLTKADGVHVFDISQQKLVSWTGFAPDGIPGWTSPLAIHIWQPAHGSLIWHTSQPTIAGATHRSLVMNLFARRDWDEQRLRNGERLIDVDLSPILQYTRGTCRDGKRGPNTVLAPPSNLKRVGPEYERWVMRSLAWIRRRGKIVHDWRKQSTTIPNPLSLLNTIYAFPDVEETLKSRDHEFAIL